MNNDVIEFCDKHNACSDGRKWALTQRNMAEVFDTCARGDWLMWMLVKSSKLTKATSVKLACEFALRVLPIYEKKFGRKEPRLAVEAALRWLEDPTEENASVAASAARAAASAAASAAYSAASAADSAAYSAARAADSAASAADSVAASAARAAASADSAADSAAASAASAASAADSAAYSADSAAYSAAYSAERKAQCDIIRSIVKNPWGDLK
ncbi:MAG: hypothetical protein P3A28_09035 [Gemmatimonadota bacterium]|nr:hypothetical protein [Gemmatimonadota bacterium]